MGGRQALSTYTQYTRLYNRTKPTSAGFRRPIHGTSKRGSFSGGGNSNLGRSVDSNLGVVAVVVVEPSFMSGKYKVVCPCSYRR